MKITLFLWLECIGMSRGDVAMRLLLEMNHEVRGDCVQESIEQVFILLLFQLLSSRKIKQELTLSFKNIN